MTILPIGLMFLQDRILVFHRGLGLEKISGLLIDQKLDLLMDYTVFSVLNKVKEPVRGSGVAYLVQQ